MTGSIKDRMALHVLRQAYASGAIKAGDTIAEATSGNTGIAFSAVGRALGHPVTIFMPDWMSRERIALISSFGASIVPVSRRPGGFLGSIRLSEELAAREKHVFLPCQFSNEANTEAHFTSTGPEISASAARRRSDPDAFVAGVGTGGTVMGVGRFLRSKHPTVRVHPLEPAESPTMSTGEQVGSHRIQGISDEFIPAIVKLTELDRIIEASDGDSILMAQKLAHVGLAVGISSGANLIGALQVQDEIGGRHDRRDHPERQQQEVPKHGPDAARASEARLPIAGGPGPRIPIPEADVRVLRLQSERPGARHGWNGRRRGMNRAEGPGTRHQAATGACRVMSLARPSPEAHAPAIRGTGS